MLSTALSLPFTVRLGSHSILGASVGGDIRVLVTFRPGAATTGLIEDVEHVIQAFERLAEAGALAGSALRPVDSLIAGVERLHDARAAWLLTGCKVDERSWVILTNWLRGVRQPLAIESVLIGDPPFEQIVHDRFSEQYPGLSKSSCAVVEVPPQYGEDIRMLIAPERELAEGELTDLMNRLATCVTAISLGAYGQEPSLAQPYGCTFDSDFDTVAGDIAFCVWRLRADPAAALGLVNACIAHFEEAQVRVRISLEG